ncbi:MAG: T9SS type A sorting domain-containing protein [Tannerella sp.]|jgi:hypothetical protein|nr:T9SS type A sorting domain-containing protein [Tannerella sp.]
MSDKQLANTEPILDIRLYDQFGRLVRSTTAKNSIVQFNVSDLPNGIYFLRVYDGLSDEPETQTIIVKH